MVSGCYRFCPKPGKAKHFRRSLHGELHQENGGVCPAVLLAVSCRRDQRRSCSTLACDWLASASAETAIDWRGAPGRVLGAFSVVSANGGLGEPVCCALITVFAKSWRFLPVARGRHRGGAGGGNAAAPRMFFV